MAETIATYLVRVAATTIVQLLTLFGPGLALVAAISVLSRYVTRLALLSMGRYLYLLLFGWLGTTIHEIGHALAALLFGHRIVQFRPFMPDARSGRVGQVISGYNSNSIYQQIGLFFIGIAPILFGTSMIFVALLILFQREMIELIGSVPPLTDSSSVQSSPAALLYQILAYCTAILAFIFSPAHFADWRFYLFLYLTFAIGSSIHLSEPDIKAAAKGFTALVVLVLVFNLITLWQSEIASGSFSLLSQSYAFFYAILLLTLALNALAALLLLVPALVLGGR